MINIKIIILVFCILLLFSKLADWVVNRTNKYDNKLFFNSNDYPITKILENNWKTIAKECANLPRKMISSNGRNQFVWYGDTEMQELADSYKNDYGWINGWKVDEEGLNKKWENWGLIYDGQLLGYNSKICPETTKLLSQIKGIRVAGFSILKANGYIPSHTDTTGLKFNSLAYHLGLDVPKDASCELYVLNKSMKEENGKSFLFDATNLHSADNKSKNYDRAILYIDFDLDGIKKK